MSLALATRGFFGSGSSDPNPPEIVIVSPLNGATIGPSTHLVFRMTDDVGIRRALPAIKFTNPDNTFHYEIIHDGEEFTSDYSGTRTAITGGWEYDVVRKGGWTATISHTGGNPALVPFMTDTGGNEPA